VLNALEASYLLQAGRRDEALARLNRALDIAPNFWLAHYVRGRLYLADQQPDNAVAEMRRAVELGDNNSRPSALLAACLARVGKNEEARKILNELLTLSKTRYVPPSSLAAVYAALGEVEAALDSLDRAFLAHDTQLTYLKDDPRLASLSKEPRFGALLHKLQLDNFGPGLSPS